MADVIVLQFKKYRDDLSNKVCIEAKAIDSITDLPLVSLPLVEMADWLKSRGYRWRAGSNGEWAKST